MKRVCALFLISLLIFLPLSEVRAASSRAKMSTEFHYEDTEIKEVKFVSNQDIVIDGIVRVPANSSVNADIYQSQEEKRWHKSGYIVCKLREYKPADETEYVDMSSEDIYLIARKYVPVDGFDATITGIEIVGGTVAACFIPGVDVAYFFIKGAIQREKHPNWFKAGVSNAWDNSIFWFPQKGKNIELNEGSEITIKPLEKEKADIIKTKVGKQKIKKAFKNQKKRVKSIKKQAKKYIKNEKKEAKLRAKKERQRIKAEERKLKHPPKEPKIKL